MTNATEREIMVGSCSRKKVAPSGRAGDPVEEKEVRVFFYYSVYILRFGQK
jgi:hypothetical protein